MSSEKKVLRPEEEIEEEILLLLLNVNRIPKCPRTCKKVFGQISSDVVPLDEEGVGFHYLMADGNSHRHKFKDSPNHEYRGFSQVVVIL